MFGLRTKASPSSPTEPVPSHRPLGETATRRGSVGRDLRATTSHRNSNGPIADNVNGTQVSTLSDSRKGEVLLQARRHTIPTGPYPDPS